MSVPAIPLPEINFEVVVADPPWPFVDRLPGGGRGAGKHYKLMQMDAIKALPVKDHLAEDAILWLWVPNAFLVEAHEVAAAWGFVPKTMLTWVKVDHLGKPQMGMGHYLRSCTEQCLIATKGRYKVTRHDKLNVIFSPRERHSQKPEAFYELVRSTTLTPRLEMFARHAAEGFYPWGDEAPNEQAEAGSESPDIEHLPGMREAPDGVGVR